MKKAIISVLAIIVYYVILNQLEFSVTSIPGFMVAVLYIFLPIFIVPLFVCYVIEALASKDDASKNKLEDKQMALTKGKECGNDVSAKADSCPKCGAKIKAKSIGCGGLILVLIVIGIIGALFSQNSNSPSSTPSKPSAADIERQVKEQVKIKKLSWHKSGFDNVMLVNATFENKSNRAVKDIELTCEHYSNSGTKIDSNSRVIYEVVEPGKSKGVHDFNMGFIHSQAAKTSCSITDLVVQ